MKIIIWGTGVRGKKAKEVCNNRGYEIKAFTDNDPSHWGGGKIDDIPIVPPDKLTEQFLRDTQIWIATGAEEVYKQAKKISDNIIEWPLLKLILLGDKYPYTSPNLREQNITHCKLLENRNELLKCFSDSNHWKMAEVGVFQGDFSEQILKVCKPEKLFLIDLWEKPKYEEMYTFVGEKFKSEIENGTVEMLRGLSIEKLKEFEEDELDWVYIDTVHDYDTTKAELELCCKKVKDQGYICGHDYAKHNVLGRVDYGVFDAVNEFVVTHDYEFIYMTLESHGLQSFCLRKI